MTKIAISTDSGNVSEHFGRCPEFTIVETKAMKVSKKETIPNPGHRTGFLPKFFKKMDVKYVIAGGAGSRAQQFFEEYGIKLIIGIRGNVDDVIESFLEGKLRPGESMCSPGRGRDYGIAKGDGNHNH